MSGQRPVFGPREMVDPRHHHIDKVEVVVHAICGQCGGVGKELTLDSESTCRKCLGLFFEKRAHVFPVEFDEDSSVDSMSISVDKTGSAKRTLRKSKKKTFDRIGGSAERDLVQPEIVATPYVNGWCDERLGTYNEFRYPPGTEHKKLYDQGARQARRDMAKSGVKYA